MIQTSPGVQVIQKKYVSRQRARRKGRHLERWDMWVGGILKGRAACINPAYSLNHQKQAYHVGPTDKALKRAQTNIARRFIAQLVAHDFI